MWEHSLEILPRAPKTIDPPPVADLGTGATGASPLLAESVTFFNIDYASIMMQLLIFSPPFSIPSLILINL